MKTRFIKIPQGMSFEQFKEEYIKAFPISNAKKREEVMRKEYDRLTALNESRKAAQEEAESPAEAKKPSSRRTRVKPAESIEESAAPSESSASEE
jgi:hypothetical protein